MTTTTHHDLVVIGSGSGNMVTDDSFKNLDVAIIEDRRVGGTCLNFGCIPSKLLAYTAEVAETVTSAGSFGVDADLRSINWVEVRDRVFGHTDHVSDGGRRGREKSDWITLYAGHARFTGPRQLSVDTEDGQSTVITADRIVIACGGRPVVPPVVAESGLPYETSDTVMRVDAPPKRLAVLGGGYIAAELARVFATVGSHITIIERGEHLLGGPQDDDIRVAFTDLMAQRHDLRLGTELTELSGTPGDLLLTLDDGSTVQADMLLVASGRTSNADRLDVDVAGIETHDSGRIKVDEFCRTSVEGIFALGDVSTSVPLKHVANREAEVVAHNLHNPNDLRRVDLDHVPSAVFTDPQIASVGRTERDCRDADVKYVVGKVDYSDVAYGWALQDDTGFCKVIVDEDTDLVLGAHIMGPQASTLIQTLVLAIEFDITATDLSRRPFWIHPALTEVIDNALRNIEPKAA
ncbi:mycothione reductase [Mycobacterium sp.]|uniref:mycothione reductase n=1 Tax=Mycobacterium sp. TaxID=1785 RepID=UPI0025E310F8|nr:mycothione reductase [Mycobacterium sp.]